MIAKNMKKNCLTIILRPNTEIKISMKCKCCNNGFYSIKINELSICQIHMEYLYVLKHISINDIEYCMSITKVASAKFGYSKVPFASVQLIISKEKTFFWFKLY